MVSDLVAGGLRSAEPLELPSGPCAGRLRYTAKKESILVNTPASNTAKAAALSLSADDRIMFRETKLTMRAAMLHLATLQDALPMLQCTDHKTPLLA